MEFIGYQEKIDEFIWVAQYGQASILAGLVKVRYGNKALKYLWNEVKGIFHMVNAYMKTLFNLFVVGYCHDL